jgi:hypothetical protein
MATKIQIRRDTAANWTSANPTLSSGEQGFETDTGKVKIGDGSTAWTSLAYFAGYTDGDVDTHLNTSTASNGEYLSWTGSDYDWAAVPPGYNDADVDTHLNVSGASSSEILSWTGADYDWVAAYANADVDTHLNVSGSGDNQILSWTGSDYGWVDQGYPTVTSDNFLEASAADKPFYMIYVGNIANRINLVTEGNALSWDNAFTTLEDAFAFVVGHSSSVSAYSADLSALSSSEYMIVLEDEGTAHAMGSASVLGLDDLAQKVHIYSQSEFRLNTPATNEISELSGDLSIKNCQYVEISNSVKITGLLDISASNVFIDSYTGNTLAATDFEVTSDITITDHSYFEATENDIIVGGDLGVYKGSMAYVNNDITCTGDIRANSNSNLYINGVASCDDVFIAEESSVVFFDDVTTTDDFNLSESSSAYVSGVLTVGGSFAAIESSSLYVDDEVIAASAVAFVNVLDNSSIHIDGDLTLANTTETITVSWQSKLNVQGSISNAGDLLVSYQSKLNVEGITTNTGDLLIDFASSAVFIDNVSCASIGLYEASSLNSYGDITSTVGDISVSTNSSMSTTTDADVGTSKIISAGNLNIEESSNVWTEEGATIATTLNVLNGSSFIADDVVDITSGDINVYDNSSFYVDEDVTVTAGNMEVQYNSKASIIGVLTTLEHVESRFNSSIFVDSDLECEFFEADFNSDLTVWGDATVSADLTDTCGIIEQNGRVFLSGSIIQSSATHTGAVVEITTGGELTHDSSSLSVAGSGTFTIDGNTSLTTAQFTGKSFFGDGGSAVKDVDAGGNFAFLGMPTADPGDGLSLWVDTAASNVVKLSIAV